MATSDVLLPQQPTDGSSSATSSMIKPEDFLSSKDEDKVLDDTDSSDLPPISAPVFVRQKTKEEEKEETDAFLPLAPAFRRQRSFPHTIRPVPVLAGGEEEKKNYFHDILKGMGFDEEEVEAALKGGTDKGIEELVEIIVAERKTKGSTSPAPTPTSPVTPSSTPASPSKVESPTKETKEKISEEEPLALSLDEEEATDWNCRFCNGFQNSSATEVCIQCNRARALCEQLSDKQLDEEKKKETQKKKEEEDNRRAAEQIAREQEEMEKLENGPWPCRFCDQINENVYNVCRACASPKYLTRVLLTQDEWLAKLRAIGEEQKMQETKDREYKEEWEKKKKAGGAVECLICFDDVLVKDVVFAECQHNFCFTCWNGYLETKVKDGDVLKLNCPAPKCRRAVTKAEIKARLTPELYEKFNKFYTQAQLSLNPNTRWCPTPDCESVMFGSKDSPRLECPKCHHAICFRCNHDWHTGTCERAARGMVGYAADRAAFAAYAAVANIKPCPQCRTPIAKDEGCNHMTCQRCHYEFCWMCRGRYTHDHFAPWNIFGCPGGQEGCLACLGDDRCLCIDCSCGSRCCIVGFIKRSIMKILLLGCALACCPCIACVALYALIRRW